MNHIIAGECSMSNWKEIVFKNQKIWIEISALPSTGHDILGELF
jgi:hypothetical protein